MQARRHLTDLMQIPNIGKAIAKTLENGGLHSPSELIGADPYALYDRLCSKLETRLDPCLLDTLIAAVDYMEGGAPRKWWEFTAERKRHMRTQEAS